MKVENTTLFTIFKRVLLILEKIMEVERETMKVERETILSFAM